ncbi:hypothetical protein BSKO_08749 [Bryopsis sp. KO-2023]|nr:hypothetical protein BSKO_08749 [Bryopsis sp. KO-2023]
MEPVMVDDVNSAGLTEQAASELNRLFLMDGEPAQLEHQRSGSWMPAVNNSASAPHHLQHQYNTNNNSRGMHNGGHARSFSQPLGGAQEHVGWGGQAIPDSGGYRVPWFGRSRGKATGNRNKGRVRAAANERKGKQGHARWGNRNENEGSNGTDDVMSVEEVTSMIRSVRDNQALPEKLYQALYHFDSRTCSVLLKDLSKVGLGKRAVEIFDGLRRLDVNHVLYALCDVYTYTAMISMCIYQHNVDRALELAQEMRDRNIERNVHTYTALMNVCIKCGKCQLALETYNKMRQDGIVPNVVTYNTLIDVYGKMGQWEQAVKVLAVMKSEGVDPVLRTYNTLIIACNMCNQPREALAVYNQLLSEGFAPNATTYNALISAYGKAGQLEKVMEVFQEMVWKGCERSVITYSSLISACEKAGQWEIALELFNEMHQEGCVPNTVTYNSLITACAQGAQWEKAGEVFEQMQVQGCTPDVVTYTALISAYERGGQWRRALQAYEQMCHQRCKPDAIVYNAIIDAIWETGVIWAQRKALQIFMGAYRQGHFRQQPLRGRKRVEVNLHAMTAGVAVLSLYHWLLELKKTVVTEGTHALPAELCIVTDKGRNSKEQGNLVVKEAVAAMMNSWDAPFRPVQDTMYSGVLEASGSAVASWLETNTFEEHLFSFFPCTSIMPSIANQHQFDASVDDNVNSPLDDPGFSKEISVETRCAGAFSAVNSFESSHSLALQAMGLTYLQHRTQLVSQLIQYGKELALKEEIAHDAVLLMDRTMSTAIQIKDNLLELLSVACLVLAMKQADPMGNLPPDEELERVTDCKASAVAKMEWNLHQVLGSDTATISTLRCLKLYLERLGSNFLDAKSAEEVAGHACALIEESMTDVTFLNCRPSVVAAAVLYAERRSRGIIPFWPSMLAKLTGYQDMSSPELTVAIRGAQKLCQRLSTKINKPIGTPQFNNSYKPPQSMSVVVSSPPSSLSLPAMAAAAAAAAGVNFNEDLQVQMARAAQAMGLTSLGSAGLTSQNSLASLASLQSLQNMQALVSMPSGTEPGQLPIPSSSPEELVTAGHIEAVSVAQGLPQGVVQGLAHVVTQGVPQQVAQGMARQPIAAQAPTAGIQSPVFQQMNGGGSALSIQSNLQ